MRTFHPGTKFDYMPVLIGDQGLGKSTLARKLAMRDEFFTDSLTGIGTKVGAELVQGNLIVEIAELEAIKGKELETVKAFISRTSDDYRAPYAKRVEKHLRRFALIGTTNSNHFLSDPSGNRRFLPVRCGIHEPRLSLFSTDTKHVIGQAWAEMLHYYRQSDSLPVILPDALKADVLHEQDEASVDDARIGIIGAWLDSRELHERVCVIQICEIVLDAPRGNRKQWLENEVRGILERHFPEWERLKGKQRVTGYGTQRAYEKREQGDGLV
jgi:predicted P-loop ATPase